MTCCQNLPKAPTDLVYFHVAGSEPAGATFMCQFDSDPPSQCLDAAGAACTFPYSDCSAGFIRLLCGMNHTLRITATDACGNTGTTTYTFFVACPIP